MSAVDRTRLPLPGPEPAFAFPAAEKTRFDNGLALWSLQRGTLPLVTVVVSLPSGSRADPAGGPGLASLTADMLDEGTADRSAIDIQEALARLGAELGTDAAHDAVTISLTLLQRHLADGLNLLADIICRPRLAGSDVERVRALKLNRLRQLRDVPAALAERVFAESLYENHPYAHLPFGTSASLERLSRDDIASFHETEYVPDAATVVIVGPAPSPDVRTMVGRAFGAWRNGNGTARRLEPGPVRPETVAEPGRLFLVDRPGAAQTELRIGHVAVQRKTPDFHALLVLNAVLGGQFVSRINLNLRERKGYTYGARTAFEFRRQPGPFSLATSVQTEATADAIAEALGEIAAIRRDRPVTLDELTMAQQTLTLGYPRNFESTDLVARALSQLVQHELPDDTFAVFAPRVRAQDVTSVTTAAAAHLRPERLVVVAVGDAARIGGDLRGLGLGEPRQVDPVL